MKTVLSNFFLSSSLFLCFVFTSSFLYAPTVYAQKAFAFGGKAGISVSSFQVTNADEIEERVSGLGGIFLNWQINPFFTLQPEALITQKGATYTRTGTSTFVKLQYFEVPLLAKLRLPIGESFYPHVLIGPSLAVNIGSSYTSTDTQSGAVLQVSPGEFSSPNLLGLIGFGFDVQRKHFFYTMDARYSYGFNEIGDNDYSVRNVGWSYSVGVGYRIGSGSGL